MIELMIEQNEADGLGTVYKSVSVAAKGLD
jgi:hypothetical protein